MTIRWRVYYWNTPEDASKWNGRSDHFKLVRASSAEQAIVIFQKRFPDLKPAFAMK